MTAKQMIKKIEEAGISIKGIEVTGRNEIEVPNRNRANQIFKVLPTAGGYKTGYSTWVIQDGYRSNPLVTANID